MDARFLVMIVAVAATLGSLTVATYVEPSLWGGTGNSSVGTIWAQGFNGCCFDDNVSNAVVLPLPTVPAGTSLLYLEGNLSVAYWTHFNGTGNETGTCTPPTGPAGACNVYIGIWTPSAWDTYVAGGPLRPYWCYAGDGASCMGVSNASFTTPSLVSTEGQTLEVVIWNTQYYGLDGSYNLSLCASSDWRTG